MRECPSPKRSVRHAGLAIVGLVAAVSAAAAARPGGAAGDPRPAAACSSAEFRQFDFWAGDWDTYDVAEPAKLVARNKVTSILGGCALREVYEQNDGLVGESFSIYDASRGRWHQSWVTNRGALLLLDGSLDDGRVVLTGAEKAADGASSLLRAIWWVEGKTVREKAERSADGGRTWAPVFDIVFRPHRTS